MFAKLMLVVSTLFYSLLSIAAAHDGRIPTSYRTPEQKSQFFRELGLMYTDHTIWHPYLGSDDLRYYFSDEMKALFTYLKISHVIPGASTKLSPDDMKWMMHHTPKLAELFGDHNLTDIVHDSVSGDSPSPRYLDSVMLRPTPKIGGGFGLFAARAFKAHDFIGEYTGKVLYALELGHDGASRSIVRWLQIPEDVSYDEATKETMLDCAVDQSYNQLYLSKHPIFYVDTKKYEGVDKEWLTISAFTHRNEIAFANNTCLHPNAETRLVLMVRALESATGEVEFKFDLSVALFASDTILEGDQILFDYGYSEKSLKILGKTFVPLSPSDDRGCSYCDAILAKPLRCSSCKTTFYCDNECQKKHWSAHKSSCSELTTKPAIPTRKPALKRRERHRRAR